MATLLNSQTVSESAHLTYSNTIESDTTLGSLVAQTAKELVKEESVTVLEDHSDFSLDVIREMAGSICVTTEPLDEEDV